MSKLKLKPSMPQRISSRKWKDNPQNGRKYMQIIYHITCIQKIWGTHDSTKWQITQLKTADDLDRHFSKEDIQIANKDIKGCSTSLVMIEMQLKATVRYHFTSSRLAINSRNGQ